MKSIQECLGQNVKRLRNERGLTQNEFAARTKLSASFIQSVESGKRWVGPETIATLAKSLKVSESDLFHDCDRVMKPDPKATIAHLCEVFGVMIDHEHLKRAEVKRPHSFHF